MQAIQITTENPIAAPASAVWPHLRSGDGVDKWFAPITSCRVEGNRRYCEAGDAYLKETILETNDDTMTFRYRIDEQTMMPVTGIVGGMRLESTGPESCVLHWDVNFVPNEGVPVDMLREQTTELYAIGAKGLEETVLASV